MSKLTNHLLIGKKCENKNDFSQTIKNDNRFLLDIQLFSELKSIPGKIIPLSNNDIAKNNKENCNDKNNKKDTNNKIYSSNNKSIFTPIDKSNNNNNNINNSYTTNNFFLNKNISFSIFCRKKGNSIKIKSKFYKIFFNDEKSRIIIWCIRIQINWIINEGNSIIQI